MALVTVLAGAVLLDGSLSRLDGALLLAGIAVYVLRSALAKREIGHDVEEITEEEMSHHPTRKSLWRGLGIAFVGLIMLALGAKFLVDGVSDLARALGVPEYIISLSIVAFGTSLPELVTSVQAARKGHPEIAVANVLGSNVFNLLAVLGLGASVAPIAVPAGVLARDLWIMAAATAACLPIMLTGGRVTRLEGGLLALVYLGYAAVLLIHQTR